MTAAPGQRPAFSITQVCGSGTAAVVATALPSSNNKQAPAGAIDALLATVSPASVNACRENTSPDTAPSSSSANEPVPPLVAPLIVVLASRLPRPSQGPADKAMK